MSDATIHSVRTRVRQLLAAAGLPTEAPVRETLLIRNGNYCGRRFESDGAHAVWFMEEDQIKLYSPEGLLLSVANASSTAVRRAA
jgi:hypothetical protein